MNLSRTLAIALVCGLTVGCGSDSSSANNDNNTNNTNNTNNANNGNNSNNANNGNNLNNIAPNNSPGEDPDPTGCGELDQARADSGDPLPKDTCWLASSALFLSTETLTVEEGVVVYFAENAALRFLSDAKLAVEGTSAKPVFFTRAEKDTTWGGLSVESNSSKNSLNFAVIEYTNENPALTVTGNGKLAIDNSLVRLSDGTGILAGGPLTIANTSVTTTKTPMEIPFSNIPGIGDGNDFTGNTNDVIEVEGGTIEEDAAWAGANVPYLFNGNLNIESNLTIAAGAMFTMRADSGITVRSTGSLSAIGDDENHIVFASQDDEVGYWKGFHFASPSSNNVLDYVDIFGGGSGGWTGSSDSRATIYVDSGSKLTMSNSSLKGSAFYAMFLGEFDGSADVALNTTTVTENARTAEVNAETAAGIGSDNTFVGNTEDGIRIQRGIDVPTEWAKIDVPWLIHEALVVDAEFTIAAGSTFEVAADVTIWTYWAGTAGKIIAEGTVEDPIVFTGIDKTPGYWQGLAIRTPGSILKNVVIEYGGSDGFDGGDASNAAFGVMDSATADLDGVTIKDSGGFGLFYEDSATVTCNNMTYTNNARGDFSGDPVTCM